MKKNIPLSFFTILSTNVATFRELWTKTPMAICTSGEAKENRRKRGIEIIGSGIKP